MDESAIFFGGSAARCGFKCGKGFAFGGELEAALAAFFRFAIEGLCNGSGTTHGAEGEDLDGEFSGFIADEEVVTDVDFTGGFGGVGIEIDAAKFAGAGCKSAGFEEASSPEPLVNSD